MEYTLYSVLQAMINAYSDEENKYNRLIEMINRNTSTKTIERYESIEIMQNDLKIANNNLEAAQEDYKIAQNRIQELEEKVKELEEQLNSE